MSAYDFDLRSNCLPDSVSLKVIYYSVLHAQISEWICIVSESASLVAQLVKNLPVMWETWVWSLGWEDPLEKGKTTHSSILAWRIPWIIWSLKESDATEWLSLTLWICTKCTLKFVSWSDLKFLCYFIYWTSHHQPGFALLNVMCRRIWFSINCFSKNQAY